MNTFQELGLLKELLKAVEEKKYKIPTPVQEQVIPIILEKEDLMAGSQTGTGKTAGFTLPLLQLLMTSQKKEGKRPLRALILTPTRELAVQVGENVKTYGKYLPLKSALVFGGVNMRAQVKEVRNGVDIIIATPGRLLDHISQKTINLSSIELLVLDEADRMLDMGFIQDIRKIISLMPSTQQNLLFSATFSQEIKQLAGSFLKSPKTITIAPQHTTAELITQTAYGVDKEKKKELLCSLIIDRNWQQVLIFTRTKHAANKLADYLIQAGIRTGLIHGSKTQAARAKALRDFKLSKVRILVATDIAARGLDIHHLPYVVNFELPFVPEDYIHRIGRTGRAGNTGEAISLISQDERSLLQGVERVLKKKIPIEIVPGYEPAFSTQSKPAHFKKREGFKSFHRNQKPSFRKRGGESSEPRDKNSFSSRNKQRFKPKMKGKASAYSQQRKGKV